MSHITTPILIDLKTHPEWSDDEFRSSHECHTELSRRARAGNHEAVLLMVQTVLRHSGLPRQISRFPDPDDMVSEIIVRLVELAPEWDPDRGVPWRAYAKQRVWWLYHRAAKKRYAAKKRDITSIDFAETDYGQWGSYEWPAAEILDVVSIIDRLRDELGDQYITALIDVPRRSWRHDYMSSAVSGWIAAGSPADTPIVDPDSRLAVDARR